MALNSLFCADVPLSNYSLTHPNTKKAKKPRKTQKHKSQRKLPTCCFVYVSSVMYTNSPTSGG